jgi:hypothetical protein
LVVFPTPFIAVAIFPIILAESLFDSLYELSLVVAAVLPGLFSLAVLEVSSPSAFVGAAIFPAVRASAVGLVVQPLAFIAVAIFVGELSHSPSAILFPLSLVFCAVGPNLGASALPHEASDLSVVDGSVFESDYFSFERVLIVCWACQWFELAEGGVVESAVFVLVL